MVESGETPGISGIGQIMVRVQDLDRATQFYRDVLGIPFLFAVPNMAFFMCGEVRLMLGIPERDEIDHPASIIYYRVDDIAAAHTALVERGVAFEEEPTKAHEDDNHELWLAFFRDTEENMVALMSEVPK